MRAEVRWTNLTPTQIARRLAEMGTPAHRRVVKQLLDKHGYRRRKSRKAEAMGKHPDRDAQFRNIARLKQEYLAAGEPVISIDTKKKELLGNFHREGTLYTRQTITTFDHDFPSFAKGAVIPHGIYDLEHNLGHINLNMSHDTSQFACDSIAKWWQGHGQKQYPNATKLLLLCDGGGSNSASRHMFKQDLQSLADRLGLEIRVAHYPPYCSKYNPIEHRMFPHVTRACRGVIFHGIDIVKRFMEKTSTTQGLKVTVDLLDGMYETGRKCTDGIKQMMKIAFDDVLPKWNYRALPSPA